MFDMANQFPITEFQLWWALLVADSFRIWSSRIVLQRSYQTLLEQLSSNENAARDLQINWANRHWAAEIGNIFLMLGNEEILHRLGCLLVQMMLLRPTAWPKCWVRSLSGQPASVAGQWLAGLNYLLWTGPQSCPKTPRRQEPAWIGFVETKNRLKLHGPTWILEIFMKNLRQEIEYQSKGLARTCVATSYI